MNTQLRSMNILAIPGSLRRESYNRSLLRAAVEVAPENAIVTVYDDLATVPVFNEDLEKPGQDPPGVRRLRRAVASADGILISTPEYNQSVPGVVKNAVDWLSRSGPGEGLAGRPVAVTGATTGPWGTRISQTLLRQMLLSVQALVLPQPTLFVPCAETIFDQSGRLSDQTTRALLGDLVTSFADWIRLVSPSKGLVLQ